jgi:hypothetical protein
MSNKEIDPAEIANNPREITLKDKQFNFIQEMAKKHGLKDESKAIRILIEYARKEAHLQDEIFDSVRCAHC